MTAILSPSWVAVGRSCILTLCGLSCSLCGTAAADDDAPSPERQALLEQREKLAGQITEFQTDHKLPEAISGSEQKLAIERELFGNQHKDVVATLTQLGHLYVEREDFTAAARVRREILDTQRQLHDPADWHVTDARLRLEELDRLVTLTPEQRQRLREAADMDAQMLSLRDDGKYAETVPLARQSFEIRNELLGMEHPDTLLSHKNLGRMERDLLRYDEAEVLLKENLRLRRSVLGEGHPDCAYTLCVLGWVYFYRQEWKQADACFRQALDIYRVVGEDKAVDLAMTLTNLGQVTWQLADYVQAEAYYREAADVYLACLGESHPDYADSLNYLANACQSRGDVGQSMSVLRGAIELDRRYGRDQDPEHAQRLNNLAFLCLAIGDDAGARPLVNQALEIMRAAGKQDWSMYPDALHNLGRVHAAKGEDERAESSLLEALSLRRKVLADGDDNIAESLNALARLKLHGHHYDEAEALCREALNARRSALGEKHPWFLRSLETLADVMEADDRSVEAEPLLLQCLATRREILGNDHPETAANLVRLATHYLVAGQPSQAEPLAHEAVQIGRRFLDLTADSQGERQQLATSRMLRSYLDTYLTITLEGPGDLQQAYREALAWKGSVLVRQRTARAVADDPEIRPQFEELQRVASRLSRLALSTPDAAQLEGWRKQLEDLQQEEERLESELATLSAAFRQAKQEVTLEDVLLALRSDTALVDYLEFDRSVVDPEATIGSGRRSERHLLACVLRSGMPVEPVDLGPVAPIEEAIDQWRSDFGMSPDSIAAGDLLRSQLWSPLAARLDGAKLVLISPDAAVARLPFAALPGREAGTYLLEEWSIAVLPVPQTLPALVSEAGREAVADNLLLMGGIEYDSPEAAPDDTQPRQFGRKRAVRWSGESRFEPLPATLGEVAGIEKRYRISFGSTGSLMLSGAEASEEQFRREAPRHLYLHLATHGFFAPPELQSALTRSSSAGSGGTDVGSGSDLHGYDPGLLSGIVLAGANSRDETREDDGILTADEVSTLDLRNVELAVLSACETGLGEVAGGEGLLGLQRAFQVAGTSTTIASQWKVNDNATRDLMDRFYDNLWNKQLDTLSALREAQLWMLNSDSYRGLRIRSDEEPSPEKRTSPEFWAAFELSGDWR